jgi:hypothetical protein
MNWLHYLLEANLYLAVFYAFYHLFLNKETHYTLNRIYLLLSCIISFMLPVMQIGALKPVEAPVQTYTTVVTGSYVIPAVGYRPPVSQFTLQDAAWYAYLLGITVMALILIIKITRLIKMTGSTKTIIDNKYKLIGVDGVNTAFSFFNYLFIGSKTAGNDIIIRHELVHIRQKHSADIVFMELIKIISWFNPIIYFMQISLKTVHEYIADEQTAAHETDALTYSSFLVNNAYGLNGTPLSHSFFNYNLLKKRIIMLNQKRSGNLARLKYLAAVPICAGMLCASTLAFSKNYGWVDLAPAKTVISGVLPTKPLSNGQLVYIINPASYTTDELKTISTELLENGYTMTYREYSKGNNAMLAIKVESKPGSMVSVDVEAHASVKNKNVIKLFIDKDANIMSIRDDLKEHNSFKGAGKLSSTANADTSVNAKPQGFRFPPPTVVPNGYSAILHHLDKTLKYPKNELNNKQAGFVVIAFNVDASHKVSNFKIAKSSNTSFGDAVTNSLQSFTGTVADKPGEHKIAINFFTDYYAQAPEYKADIKNANADLYTFIMPPPPPMPPAGLKSTGKMPPPPPPEPPVKAKGKHKMPPPPPPAPPLGAIGAEKMPPPPPPQNPFDSLTKYIARMTRYPTSARDNHIGGRLILWVTMNNGKIDDVKLARSVYDDIDNEVIRVLKSYTGPLPAKSGYYSLSVSFALVDNNDQQVAHAAENYTQKSTANNIVSTTPGPRLSLNAVTIVGYASKKL